MKSRLLVGSLGVLTMPCQLYKFLTMLWQRFGGYVPMTLLVYGLNQGVAIPYANMARRVLFADVMKLDGATAGRYVAAAAFPWSIKPIFGMLSDAVPIFGYHRTSYIVIAGICGLVAWTSLGLLPLAGSAIVPFLLLANISVCVPDIMIDAKTAELSKAAPEHAPGLQGLSWGAFGIGGLVTCSTAGLLVDILGPRTLFLLINVCSLGVVVPGLLGWLGECHVPLGQRKPNLEWLRKHAIVSLLAAFMSVAAAMLMVLQLTVESQVLRGVATVSFAMLLLIGIFVVLRRVSDVLAKTAAFIFARECLQPAFGEAMFQWLKNCPDGPQFIPTVLSWIDCFGSLGLLLGVTIYNKYLSEVPYRRIFLGAQLAMVISSLLDFVLVKRWNLAIGIPDIVMLIGDDAFSSTMRKFVMIPMFILASKVCPQSIEATLFAMLMALSNFGGTVGDFFGVSMLEAFGVVHGDFENLADVVLAKSLCRFLPMVLVPFLVPNLRPTDSILIDGEAGSVQGAKSDGNLEAGNEDEPGGEGPDSNPEAGDED
eukprot:CAMPEP_0179087468 /NCGR_PEP_ID=MMETSP0796-20121207/39744_1 /TAXON_ID=73915 /ORGANISM="Pyrodinium bahamense, Strain pbaha01" /LENGTH=538 /DNA_ID=CAMNT_0020784977 /DNA_START=21 /DNA_END=1637 /DNA_ORIENTATION=+